MKYFAILFILIFPQVAILQSIPSAWALSPDSTRITAGQQISSGLYAEDMVHEIRLYFSENNYWQQLINNYLPKIDLPATMVFNGDTLKDVGVRFKGMTSYLMNQTRKKSFNISLDYIHEDQRIQGVKTLNLNNSFRDNSFMREVLFYQLIRRHIPGYKANFVRLFINDEDFGIYQNVQQPNKEYLKEWYATNDGINIRADLPPGTSVGRVQWGDGTAALNYLGEDSASYKKYYTLKSNDTEVNPWNELKNACHLLNTSKNLEQDAVAIFDIDKILWHLAVENIFADDDGYIYKGKMDYYLYWNEKTKRWSTYEYDANSCFGNVGINWSPYYNFDKVNYPLLNKLLTIPSIKQRYLAHYRTILETSLNPIEVNALIDKNDMLIRQYAASDPILKSTLTQYTNGLNGIKAFIVDRKKFLFNKSASFAELSLYSGGLFEQVSKHTAGFQDKTYYGDDVTVEASVYHPLGLKNVYLFYTNELNGRFDTLQMYDDGSHGDMVPDDGTYTCKLPHFGASIWCYYYIESTVNDAVSTRSYFPQGAEHDLLAYYTYPKTLSDKTVVINEFMTSNSGIISDEYGEADDWIELYNNTDEDIDLSGFFISDKVENYKKFKLGNGIVIKARDYLIIWADEDASQGALHANFKLSSSGESLILSNKDGNLVDRFDFGAIPTNKTMSRIPNGIGDFVLADHTFGKNNESTTHTSNLTQLQNRMSLYPNPSNDFVQICGFPNVKFDVQIYNILGKLLMNRTLEDQGTLDVSHLDNGVYLIQSSFFPTEKFIIQR